MAIVEKDVVGTLSISKSSDGLVNITIKDNKSNINFVRVSIKPTDFADALFGLHGRPAKIKVQGLRHVGKRKETEPACVTVGERVLKKAGINIYDRDSLEMFLLENHQREGWFLASHLGSKDSVQTEGKTLHLYFHYFRYV